MRNSWLQTNVMELYYTCERGPAHMAVPFFFSLALGGPYHNHTEKITQAESVSYACLKHAG